MVGAVILHYKILEKLGEGGMGEIYKALDTKLDRFAALKFLPLQFSHSGEEKRRFINEAKSASALNHPNVCTVYDINEYENQEGEKRSFIVMEFIDGRTLRNLDKSLSIEEIIVIGIQIADGLSAAHEKGIIHRDIKPENIMIRKDNRIQIMDFGLAKFYAANEISRLTIAGSTMGTLGYISPEQVQGMEVDYRTDIFSAGAVLYELLTGSQPFKGLHDAEIIFKIVNSDLLPVSEYRNDADPFLDLIISGCLEKKKEDRYQSAKELLNDLKNLKHEYEEKKPKREITKKIPPVKIKPVKKSDLSPRAPIKIKKTSKIFIWSALTFSALLLVFLYSALSSVKPLQINPNMKIQEIIVPFTDISIPSISSDGKWIAFPASDQNDKWDVYLMHTLIKEPRKVTSDSYIYIHYANISPDGGQIIYALNKSLYIIPSVGGIKKKIADDVIASEWRPDGKQIGFIREHYPKYDSISFWTMNTDGNNKRMLLADRWKVNGRFSFSYSPGGSSIVRSRFFDDGYDELFVTNLLNGEEKQLTFDKSNIEDQKWTGKGIILYSSNKGGNMNIWAVSESGGKSVQVTKGNGPDLEISSSSDLNYILYYQLRDFSNMWINDLKKQKLHQITFDERLITDPALSPDGKLTAFSLHKPAPEPYTQIFTMNSDGSNLRQITFNNSRKEYLNFSPGGKYLVYSEYQINNKNDIGKVFVSSLESPEPPKYLGIGKAEMWLNDTVLVITGNSFTETVSVNGNERKKIYKDSTLAFPVNNGKLILYMDLHNNKKGKYYIIPAINGKINEQSKPRFLFSPDDYIPKIITQNYIYTESSNEIWRCSFISGKMEKVNYYVNLMSYWGLGFNVSRDDKEIIYLEHKRSSKYVLIENAFPDK
ncbi:MAG: protein kinase [Ignavibacteriaceae bacterium]